jgi:kynureninase
MNEIISDVAKEFFLLPPSQSKEGVVHLLGFSQGPQPKTIKNNLTAFALEWKQKGPDAWKEVDDKEIFLTGNESKEERQRVFGWWDLPEVVGDRFVAPVLGAPRGTCIMMPNVTLAMQQILSCVELNQTGRRRVVTTDWEFPAVGHTLENFNRRFSKYSNTLRNEVELEIVRVSTDGGFAKDTFAQKMIAEINDETALVVFSHTGFLRGELVQDSAIKAIVRVAHKHGALVVIDGYHAIGSTVINVLDLGVDMYLGGFLKELCGSTGNGFLYVREGLELTPTCGGWLGDNEPFSFNEKPKLHENIRRRFLSGTTPVASLYHGIEGIKFLLQFGMEAIVKDLRAKAEFMIKSFRENGLAFVSPTDIDCASILIILKIDEADKLVEYLACRGILVDARKNEYLRMSPHVYTSFADIERATTTILDAIQTGVYKNT